jgi:hypothetical protein
MIKSTKANFAVQAARLRQLRALATLLDEAVAIPGLNVKIGLDSLIGLFPVVGDTVTALMSAYIIVQASKLGVPKTTLARMVLNVSIDFVAGSIPVAGDVFDVLWKANRKNLDLLEAHLNSKGVFGSVIDV